MHRYQLSEPPQIEKQLFRSVLKEKTTSNAHEKTIWVPYLHTAYPIKTDRRKIHQTLYELREFRNRMAHHEPLLVGSEFERRKIISVAARLLPKNAFAHLAQNREVLKLLGDRPS